MRRSLEVQIVEAARKVVAILDDHRAYDRDAMDEICEIMNGNTQHWARENGPLDEAMARYIVGHPTIPKLAQRAQPEMPTRDAMALASCELHRHETITEHDYAIADAVLALPRAPSAAALPSEDEIAKVCSSKCPICGTDTPHEHDALTVFHYRNSRLPFNSVEGARREWDRVQLLAFDKEWFDEYDIPDLGGHEELARAVWDRAVLALLNPEAGPEDDDHAYFEATGGVPFDHWGKGCPNDCAIPQHVEHKA